MSDLAAVKRQLVIKTGVVRRLTKEEHSYIQEAQQQEVHLKNVEQAGKDEWDIKQQRKVLQDCLQMIPDCRKRLAAAVEDLQFYIEGLDDALAASSECQAAKEALSVARTQAAQDEAPPASV